MRGMFFRGVVVGSITAALVVSASAALAGTGVGGIFNLGTANTVNAASSLSGATSSGAQLAVSNTSTNSAARGLSVTGNSGAAALLVHNGAGAAANFQSSTSAPPFFVNSTHTVTNLSADMVDGLHASSLVKGGGTLVSNHRTLSVGTTFATILTLPGVGAIQASCASGPSSYFNFLDGSSTAYAGTWDIEGASPSLLGAGFGFTTVATSGPRGSTVVLYPAALASGPLTVIRLWEFPGSPDSSHCSYQIVATVQT